MKTLILGILLSIHGMAHAEVLVSKDVEMTFYFDLASPFSVDDEYGECGGIRATFEYARGTTQDYYTDYFPVLDGSKELTANCPDLDSSNAKNDVLVNQINAMVNNENPFVHSVKTKAHYELTKKLENGVVTLWETIDFSLPTAIPTSISFRNSSSIRSFGMTAGNIPCISYQEVTRQSKVLPACECDPKDLPALPLGWNWIRSYEPSYEEPQPWNWISWPDGVHLSICHRP